MATSAHRRAPVAESSSTMEQVFARFAALEAANAALAARVAKLEAQVGTGPHVADSDIRVLLALAESTRGASFETKDAIILAQRDEILAAALGDGLFNPKSPKQLGKLLGRLIRHGGEFDGVRLTRREVRGQWEWSAAFVALATGKATTGKLRQ